MPLESSSAALLFDRRSFLGQGATALLGGAIAARCSAVADEPANEKQEKRGNPTEFQIACMTLPYSQFPLARALEGIKTAGYHHVAWGTTHKEEGGEAVPVMPTDAPPRQARELAGRCRDMGLEPLMMFSMIYPEQDGAVKVLTNRVLQA